jgi:hypothetical protein
MAENWITHDGSETVPVSADANVIVKLRDGNVSNIPHRAGDMFWGQNKPLSAENRTFDRSRYDIVAYYVVA